jgi:hypothetical protein
MLCVLQVEEQKRRAEADKLAALTALEARSRQVGGCALLPSGQHTQHNATV